MNIAKDGERKEEALTLDEAKDGEWKEEVLTLDV